VRGWAVSVELGCLGRAQVGRFGLFLFFVLSLFLFLFYFITFDLYIQKSSNLILKIVNKTEGCFGTKRDKLKLF
jgi:hypothetical protein